MSLFHRKVGATYRFSALAQFNAERARGIMHTPEWEEAMRRDQELFDRVQHGIAVVNGEVIYVPRDSGLRSS